MLITVGLSIVMVVLSTVSHYEMLRFLSFLLPRLSIPSRAKLIVVILGAFLGHGLQILMYAATYYLMIDDLGLGQIGGTATPMLSTCVYFSIETYTSLGFGDITPSGSVRLLTGVEALNGLLLVAWTASYTYLSMEQLWANGIPRRPGLKDE